MTSFRSEPARAFLERQGFERVEEMARLDEYLAKGFPTVPVEQPEQLASLGCFKPVASG